MAKEGRLQPHWVVARPPAAVVEPPAALAEASVVGPPGAGRTVAAASVVAERPEPVVARPALAAVQLGLAAEQLEPVAALAAVLEPVGRPVAPVPVASERGSFAVVLEPAADPVAVGRSAAPGRQQLEMAWGAPGLEYPAALASHPIVPTASVCAQELSRRRESRTRC